MLHDVIRLSGFCYAKLNVYSNVCYAALIYQGSLVVLGSQMNIFFSFLDQLSTERKNFSRRCPDAVIDRVILGGGLGGV